MSPTAPRPSPRAPRMSAGDRRAAILAAARGEFARHGFHGAGTAAIARAAGCSEAILYRHFASKKELLAETLRAEIGERTASGRALAPLPGVDPGAALPDVLAARLSEGDFAITVRLILLAISMSGDPEIGEAVREAFGAVRAPLRAALVAAQEAGAVRADIDAETLTWIWHGLFLAAAARNTIADDGVALGAVEAARVLAALLAPPSQENV